MSDAPLWPRLSSAEARRIDEICDRFEAAWKASPRPSLEEYLSAAGEPERSALLRQLLLLDWDFRRLAGDRPACGDYLARFSADHALIEDIGREMRRHADDTPLPDGLESKLPEKAVSGSARYELLEEVGHGGAGVVFRGRDRLLGRELAVKVLRDVHRQAPEIYRRFIEEARVASRLQHPAIVPVYEQGWFDDRRPYFTMKLVEGRTLAALLKDRGDPAQDRPQLLGVFEQVCQAMAYAHAQGVVHRDLKPANIMVGAFGEVQVMDWGFAKVLAAEGAAPEAGPADDGETDLLLSSTVSGRTGESQSGVVMGTPAYMPPEQAQGKSALIDPRTDVFALGAILCEILTGRPPYVGAGIEEVCLQAAQGNLADAHARVVACGADEALRVLAKRCLTAEREARPPDAGAVARDLAAYLASAQERLRQAQLDRAAAEARVEEARAKAKAERRARRLTVALAAAAVVLLASGGYVWWQHDRVQQAQAAQAAATDARVEAALAEADDRLNRNDWSGAAAAATRARELHDSGASGRWDERLTETLADVDLVARLYEARLLEMELHADTEPFHPEKAIPLFADAFARYGISSGRDPAEAAARIAGRPASVRAAVASALENWWLLALNRDAAASDWLWAVLLAVDPDEWRTKVRQAVAKSDRRALEELAAQEEALRQPPDTLIALASALDNFQDYGREAALLRPAQLRHPDDLWINQQLSRCLDLCQPPNHTEAWRCFSMAWAQRPADMNYDLLGSALGRQKDWDGVIFAARKAIELRPNDDLAYNQLGLGLEQKHEWEQAEAAFRKAAELSPNKGLYQCNFGRLLDRRGLADQAAAAYERAIQLAPADYSVQFNFGNFKWRRKDHEAALAAYAKAIELNPGFADTYLNRATVLMDQGRVDDAIAAFQQAIRLDPTSDKAYNDLGAAWRQGNSERAVAMISRAVELNPASAIMQFNLGFALQAASDTAGAAAAYREAARLDPNYAEAHYALGLILQSQGRFAEALAELEEDHRLGSPRPALLLERARRLVELDAKLPAILDGREKLASVRERLDCAAVCRQKSLFGASARLYAEALDAEPALTKSPEVGYRFLAARVAAQAGCGQGRDGSALDYAERARWRKQALDWLRADLALWADGPDRSPDGRSRVAGALDRWRRDYTLAGIREPEELAKLPESERTDYIRFWAELEELLARRLANQSKK